MAEWYAIRTATRQERRAFEELMDHGVVAYLPLQTRWRVTPRVKEPYDRPLFDGYMFVICGAGDFRRVLDVDGVHQFVRAVNRYGVAEPMPIPDYAIEGVMAEEWSGRYDYTRPSRKELDRAARRARAMQPGANVKVTEGPWAGFFATVLRMTSSQRSAVIDINGGFSFGRSLTLDVEHLDAA